MRTMGICFRKSPDTRRSRPICERKTSGASSSRLSRAWRRSMTPIFSIEILRVLMYFWIKMAPQNLVIWTYQKWRNVDFYTPRRARLTMQVLRSGAINLTIWRVTSGLSAASCTNLSRWGLRSELTIWQVCTVRFFVVSTHVSLIILATNWVKCASLWSKCKPRYDRPASRF